MNILELFCGTRSIGKVAKSHGHDVFSSDFDPKFNSDYTIDILQFDIERIPFVPDVIWASPPCTTFSVASIGRHWNKDKTPKTDAAKVGLAILRKTIDIIQRFPDAIFFIENPRGMMRTMPELNDGTHFSGTLQRHTVTYCQYGDERMKPTDIWTNSKTWQPKPPCSNGDPCHVRAPRGARTGTQGIKGAMNRSVIPPQLCEEIILSLK